MSIEMLGVPRSKPQRGDMCIAPKIVQSLVILLIGKKYLRKIKEFGKMFARYIKILYNL